MSRIFLSHSSADDAAAVGLRDWLVSEGWDDLFLDLDPERGIVGGERWARALSEAAQRCEAVVFLVSAAWLGSEWCRRELHYAQKLNKRVFGVLIEDLAIASLPGELKDTWQVVNLAAGSDHVMLPAELPDGREVHVTLSKAGLARLRAGLTKAGLDPRFFPWPPEDDPERAPYRGLPPLEAEDAGIFFGREAPIIAALDRLRGLSEAAPPRLLVILGASGAGKSSFLRAGLWARLRRDDRHFLPLPVVRPERAVLSGENGLLRCLEGALKAAGLRRTRSEVKAAVAAGAGAVGDLLAALAEAARPPALETEGPSPAPPRVVLAVDQAEELFHSEGAVEARPFLELIGALAAEPGSNLIVVMTIRSDSFERLQTEPALEGLSPEPFSLPPLPRGAYQMVIEGPAARLKDSGRPLKVDPALTAALLADLEVGGAKDALPLLSFTLERLYLEHGGDGDLRKSEYREIGGIRGSIEAAVTAALKAADVDPRVPKDNGARLLLLRRALIPWLAGIDPESGEPRRQVARLSESPEEARPVVEHLVSARLLATDVSEDTGERTIEPAHEALLRQWGLLEGWLEEDAAALALLEGVKRAARDWEANARDPDWLAHAAGRLEDAELLLQREDLARALVASHRAYLIACRAAEKARRDRELEEARRLTQALALAEARKQVVRRTRLGLAAASLLAIIAIGAAAFGLLQSAEATRQAELAKQQQEEADMLRGAAEAAAAEAQLQRAEAERQRSEAEHVRSLYLSAVSRDQASRGDFGTATALALEALRDGDTFAPTSMTTATKSALYNAILDLTERTVLSVGEAVLWADFSPDGRNIVTVTEDGTIILWKSGSYEQAWSRVAHTSQIIHAEFSPDGTKILTASLDGTAQICDVGSGTELLRLNHDDVVLGASFLPDKTRILTWSADGTARVWDANTGTQLLTLRHNGPINAAIISPDGSHIATAANDGAAIWDSASGTRLAVLAGDKVWAAAFSPDGSVLTTGHADGMAAVWDVSTGSKLSTIQAGKGGVSNVAFSPAGNHIATATLEGSIGLWDPFTGLSVAAPVNDDAQIWSAAFSADGSQFVTASSDGSARLWDTSSGAEAETFTGHRGQVRSAVFAPDGSELLTASIDGTARVWKLEPDLAPVVLRGHQDRVLAVARSPSADWVATGSLDGTVRIWDVAKGRQLLVLRGGPEVLSLAFSRTGNEILATSTDGIAREWNVKSGVQLAMLRGHEGAVVAADFSPDNGRIVTASSDKTARVWDATSGAELAVLRGHVDGVLAAHFSPDGAKIVTASRDGTARIWDAFSGAVLVVVREHLEAVWAASFSADGGRIVTASGDTTARVWDAGTGAELAELRGHVSAVNRASFSPDGSRIVTASSDMTARIWDSATGESLAVLAGHQDRVWTAAFSPDGDEVLTASKDQTARLWDGKTGVELVVFGGYQDAVSTALFSQDGTEIVTASYDNTARVWRWFATTQDLVDYARSVMPRELTAEQRREFFLE